MNNTGFQQNRTAQSFNQSQPQAAGVVTGNMVSGQTQAADSAQQAASNVFSLDTQHEDNINDCQFDYYGTQIASCDSKGFLQISSVRSDGQQEAETTFQAHEGPVWQVSWAHPKYESVIATCGYDGYVKVWKRDLNNNWSEKNIVYQYDLGSSVNCIAWAPWEYGLILGAGTAEGRLIIFVRNQDDQWEAIYDTVAHQSGVNGISWGPATEPAILSENSMSASAAAAGGKFQPPPKRLVTGGNDNQVVMWEFKNAENGDRQEPTKTVIGSHNDWVRDVAWCSNIGLMHEMIASCSEDATCKVWVSQGDGKKMAWIERQTIGFDGVPLWKVSWSQVGNMLAISGGDNQVRIMSESANGEWSQIQVVNEETSQESSGAGPSAGQH